MKINLKLPVIANFSDYNRHFNDDIWQEAAEIICIRHHLSHEDLQRSPQGENFIFFVDERYVIKIFVSFRDQYAREKAALELAAGRLRTRTPEVAYTGEFDGFPYLVVTRLPGINMRSLWPSIEPANRAEIVNELGISMRELHELATPLKGTALDRDWPGFLRQQVHGVAERQRRCGSNPEWLECLPAYIEARLHLIPAQYKPTLLHTDIHPGNVLLTERLGRWQVGGLVDFGDSMCGFYEYEFVSPGVLMVQGNRELQRMLFLAYGYEEAQLDLNLRARLMLLTILYECSDLRKYAERLAPGAINLSLDELEAAIWSFAQD